MRTLPLYVALACLCGATACEESSDKAGGDRSKPPPSPSPTSPSGLGGSPSSGAILNGGSGQNVSMRPTATPTSDPIDSIPGDVPPSSGNTGSSSGSGSGGTAPSAGTTSPGTSGVSPSNAPGTGATGGTGSQTPKLAVAATAERKAVPCVTMMVFNTGGHGALVRKDASESADPIETLVEGTKIQASALVDGHWVAASVAGKSGFISGMFLTCDVAAAAAGRGGSDPVGEAGAAGAAVVPSTSDCAKPQGATP